MVYKLKSISQNMHAFDEMPVDNIVYSRTGGCFISILKGFILTVTIILLGCLFGFLIFYGTREAFRVPREKSIADFIKEPNSKSTLYHKPLKNIVPSNYRLLIHPIFNDEERPFTYNGTLYITFAPLELNIKTLELDSKDLEVDISKVFLNRKFPNATKGAEEAKGSRSKRDLTTDDITTTESSNAELLELTSTIGTVTDITEPNNPTHGETTVSQNEYEFLELTTGVDAISEDSAENPNVTGETLTSTTSKVDPAPIDTDLKNDLYTEMLIKKVVVDEGRSKIIISLGLRLLKGSEYILRLNFKGNLTKSGYGLIYTSYKDDAGKENYFAASVSNPFNPLPPFPCFNIDATTQTTFDTSIIRTITMNSVSNTELKKTEKIDGKWSIDHYKTTRPMRLVDYGFAITQMQPTIVTVNEALSVYAYFRTEVLPILKVIDSHVPAILNELENVTGVVYPNHNINLIGVPSSFAGVHEIKYSLIIASEKNFIGQDDAEKNSQLSVVSLFFATMWFNVLIDHQQTEEAWLNIAMPMYLKTVVLNEILDENTYTDELYFLEKSIALETDVIHANIASLNDGSNEYFSNKLLAMNTIKTRGQFLLKTFQQILGTENFTYAFQQHCEKRIQDMPSSLLEHFQKVLFDNSIDHNFGTLSRLWTTTKQYPLLTTQRSRETNNLLITQENFGRQIDSKNLFSIPLEIQIENEEIDWNSLALLKSQTTEIPLDSNSSPNSSWFIINPSGIGYYRVNYDAKNWELIGDLMKENFTELHALTRCQIIDDVFHLARHGYVNYSLVFDLINNWKTKETSYIDWETVFQNIDFVYRNSADLPSFRSVKDYLINLITPTYQRTVQSLTNSDRESAPLQHVVNRWACELDITQCINSMKKSFGNLIENGTLIKSQQSEEELSVVLCNAVKFGDRMEYDIIEKSLQTDDFEYNRILISALGCCRDANYLENYYNLLLNETHSQYIQDIIESAITNRVGKFILFEMLYNRFEEITNHVGLDSFLPLIESISTEFEFRVLDSIFMKHSKHFDGTYRSVFRLVVENVHSINEWKHRAEIDFNKIQWNLY